MKIEIDCPQDGKWHMLCSSVDRRMTKIYVDGVLTRAIKTHPMRKRLRKKKQPWQAVDIWLKRDR